MITQSPRPSHARRLAQLTASRNRAGAELAAFTASLPRLRRAPRRRPSGAGPPWLAGQRRVDADAALVSAETRGYQPHGWTWESIADRMSGSSAHCRSGCARSPRPTDQ